MLDWFSEHNSTINTLANVGMLLIWGVYLQIFLRGFLRQTRPKIVINRAAGSALNSACFVSNMSSDSIYLESVIVTVERGNDRWSCAVTDIDTLDDNDASEDPRRRTHQGTLGSGDFTFLGTFDSLIERVFHMKAGPDLHEISKASDPVNVEVMIIADHASDDLLIGAKRRFRAECRDHAWYLFPETVRTKQIRSHRERRDMMNVIADQE